MPLPKLHAGHPKAAPGQFGAFYRDTSLEPGILPLYEVGVLFREPSLCDATHKFGGFAAPHRYLIVSATATCLDSLSQGPELGLCVWLPGRIFKVIGIHASGGLSQASLLEIPEHRREEHTTARLSGMEAELAGQAAELFEAALEAPALPEHRNRQWLDRLTYPLGVSDKGVFFESWRHCDPPATPRALDAR